MINISSTMNMVEMKAPREQNMSYNFLMFNSSQLTSTYTNPHELRCCVTDNSWFSGLWQQKKKPGWSNDLIE